MCARIIIIFEFMNTSPSSGFPPDLLQTISAIGPVREARVFLGKRWGWLPDNSPVLSTFRYVGGTENCRVLVKARVLNPDAALCGRDGALAQERCLEEKTTILDEAPLSCLRKASNRPPSVYSCGSL